MHVSEKSRNSSDISNLSIYNEGVQSKKECKSKSKEVTLMPGAGQRIASAFRASTETVFAIKGEFNELVDYLYSTEGKIKLSGIATCTVVTGVYGLFMAKTRLKRIGYPIGGLILSTSVCYPTMAYHFAKKFSMRSYDISKTGIAHTKYGVSVMREKLNEKLAEVSEDKNEEGNDYTSSTEEVSEDTAKLMNVPDTFDSNENIGSKDFKIGPITDELLPTITSITSNNLVEAVKEKEIPQPPENVEDIHFKVDPNKDMGQSIPEDKELYSTRTS